MRVAFVSPLPPVPSGIADYAAALLDELRKLAEVEVVDSAEARFDPSRCDVALYQVGNNPHHDFVYQKALDHPGVVVMHEANLHHLIAERTIRRDDWDAYMAEVSYDGGPAALDYARGVRAREVGPDYDGLPMIRRVLEGSRAAIAHSDFVAGRLREAGFAGPVATIPHGAWIVDGDAQGYRHRLGLDETMPLIGIFGFLKPYKRIAESLRAFRRLVRVVPNARLILAGEQHPDLGLASLITTLGLSSHVRVLDFVPIEDFVGAIAACDVVLNLRYPTVGESSGTLLRSLGLGKAALVSDVGAFREYPDDICLKVPVNGSEEDLIFEYMNLLVSRPELARAMGARARAWVARECNWEVVARRYVSFLESVVAGRQWQPDEKPAPAVAQAAPTPPAYIRGWAEGSAGARDYVETHLERLARTLAITPPGGPGDRVLEMGAYLQITPALKTRLGYGEVRGCYYGPRGNVDHREVSSADGERFECDVDLFDAEKDPFPYADGYFATVLCCELLEHLREDPMHMMAEINRILKPGGRLVLTTPNIGSVRALAAILQGHHPGFFPAYLRPSNSDEARHNREYTPREIELLLRDAGFETTLLETGPFREEPKPEHGWVFHLLERYRLSTDLRGDGIYAVGAKTGPVRERFPAWLYN